MSSPQSSDTRMPVAAPHWRLALLGGFSLQRVGADGTAWTVVLPGATPRRLLARLALYPQREHAREALVELLWPGCAPDVGRNRLRQALSTLRAVLDAPSPGQPVPWLQADRHALRLLPGAVVLDVVAFEQCCDAGQPAAALARYGGELLPGLYDEWIEDERRRLEDRAERARAALAAQATHAAQAAQAAQADQPPQPGWLARVARHDAAAHGMPAPRALHRAAAAAAGPARAPWLQPPADSPALPRYLTRPFGLQAGLDQLSAAVTAARLVTVTGSGGVGKTRLAVEFAQRLGAPVARPRFDHVAFVPWAACRQAAQAWDVLCLALPGHAPATPAGLAAQLAGRCVLLVLDNAEHLVPDVAGLLAELLRQAPQLQLLVTSRRPLGLAGERLLALAPLPLPAPDAAPAAALANPAVALLVDRAQAAHGGAAPGPADARDWVALARALEGLPLALELAASRLRALSPAQLVQALGQGPSPRLAWLRRDHRDDRHAGLERTVAWSWDGLSADAAALLAALTLFEAPFDAAAALALAPGPATGAARPAALLLAELVDSSMLRVQPPAGAVAEPARAAGADAGALCGPGQHDEGAAAAEAPSYALDAPIREYARQALAEPAAVQARRALLDWALNWVTAWPRGVPLARLRAALPNLAAALAPEVVAQAPDDAVRLWVALSPGVVDIACPGELLARAQVAVAAASDPAWRARGQSALASPLLAAGRAQEALAQARAGAGGPWASAFDEAAAHRTLARMLWRVQGDAAAAEAALDRTEALVDARPADDPTGPGGDDALLSLRASTLALRAFIANVHHRDLPRGERLHRQALALWLQVGDERAALGGRYNLAVCAERADRLDEALDLLRQVCAAATAAGDLRHLAQALNQRGNVQARRRRWAAAAEDYRASLRLAWAGLAHTELAYALWNLPAALAHLRQPQDAARLMAFAARHWQQRFGRLGAADLRDLRRLRRLVAVQCDAGACALLWAEGQGWDLARAVSAALGGLPSGGRG